MSDSRPLPNWLDDLAGGEIEIRDESGRLLGPVALEVVERDGREVLVVTVRTEEKYRSFAADVEQTSEILADCRLRDEA